MPEDKKLKVLVLSDHALSTSGVGTQTRHLLNGLLEKYPGQWTFRQFGAALKHTDYETIAVNDDFIIKPIDGFGDKNLIRVTLATEKPDILFIFTDPRFFIWLFEMEDEIHQICPIIWWHVWDNLPYPKYNQALYEATDVINCHSHLTYTMLKDSLPDQEKDKVRFLPHTIPGDIFYRCPAEDILNIKKSILGPDKVDVFTGIWVNRNAKRKRSADVLWAWKDFLDKLEKKHGHRDAVLIMHTDPMDQEGTNLYMVSEMLNIHNSVFFSKDRLDFDKMNALYNVSDFCLNISYAEGFGLSTLESMMTGTPIIAVKTGGLSRQVIDHRDGTENGVALEVETQTMVGSQAVPYIYEDYSSIGAISDGILKIYELDEKEKESLSKKVEEYANDQFNHSDMIDVWHKSLKDVHATWSKRRKAWSCYTY